MNKMIESERLILRKPKRDDYYFFHRLSRDEDVMKFIGPIMDRKESKAYFEQAMKLSDDSFGYRIAVDKITAEFVGWFVLKNLDQTSEIELGYRLMKKYWNLGLATEGCTSMINFAFRDLKLERLVAVVPPEHTDSQSVLDKLGFKFITEAEYYKKRLNYYELRKAQFMI